MRRLSRIAPLVVPLALIADRADAHAFGSRYDLPLPLNLYLTGAGAAVALSFVIMALYSANRKSAPRRPYLVLWRDPARSALWRGIVTGLRALGIALFLLVVAAGIFGDPSAARNIAPLLVWVLWWVGLLLVCAFAGNLWPGLDPWGSLGDLVMRDRTTGVRRAWPAPLAGWPAVLLLFAFAWAELVGPFGESPRDLALVILLYSAIAWAGRAVFGSGAWRANADPFRRVFGLVGAFAIFGRARSEPGRPLVIRLPGAGLLERRTDRLSDVAFVLVVLAAVTFDGFSETPLWAAFLDWLARNETIRPALLGISSLGIELLPAIRTVALIAAPAIVASIYAIFCALAALADRSVSTGRVVRAFSVSLLPIAIAYHLSHYLSYLLLAGQYAIPMASDPFGFGWNLFGTSGYMVDLGVIGARTVWYVAVAALVTGHVISVAIAHSIAMRLFPSARAATLSQIPFVVLMVAFTAFSLWILAQPVVNEPAVTAS